MNRHGHRHGHSGMPLSLVGAGEYVTLAEVAGGGDMRTKLTGMGFTPGGAVRVIRNDGGPMVVEAMGARIMLGRGMAQRMFVRYG